MRSTYYYDPGVLTNPVSCEASCTVSHFHDLCVCVCLVIRSTQSVNPCMNRTRTPTAVATVHDQVSCSRFSSVGQAYLTWGDLQLMNIRT